MKKILSKLKENTGRQLEVDLVRGFTALNMIVCHVGLYLGTSKNIGLYVFSDITGSEFAAPIFMALMGIGVIYSRHNRPKDFLLRGIFLFGLGYVLNFFRSIVPLVFFGNINEWTTIDAFFVVDILQLAGLSFMAIALCTKLKLSSQVILFISICMVLINQFIMLPESVPWDSKILTGIVNLFTPVSEWSCFPFLTWFFFPALGMFFGNVLIRTVNKNRLYLILLVIGFLGVSYVYLTFYYLYPNYTSYYFGNNFYYMGLKNVLLTSLFVFFSLAVWHFLGKILPKFLITFLSFLSKKLNLFYLISWLIIALLIHINSIYGLGFGFIPTILLMVLVNCMSACFTFLFDRLKVKINSIKFKTKKQEGN